MDVPADGLPAIVPDRILRQRWAPGRERTTWWRWKSKGKIPPADLTLPDGDAWYRETVLEYERKARVSAEAA